MKFLNKILFAILITSFLGCSQNKPEPKEFLQVEISPAQEEHAHGSTIVELPNGENWVKVSVEQENETFARLGSVVTISGYSDWATTDIDAEASEMWYRLSKRGQDYYIEFSTDVNLYNQMRMLHFPGTKARVGVYACSTIKSGFQAVFSKFSFGPCLWESHSE